MWMIIILDCFLLYLNIMAYKYGFYEFDINEDEIHDIIWI